MAKKKAATKKKAKKADKGSNATAKKAKTAKAESEAKKSSPGKGKPKAVVVLSHDAIAARAYEVWLQKGRPLGQDAENWDEAEAALRSEAGG